MDSSKCYQVGRHQVSDVCIDRFLDTQFLKIICYYLRVVLAYRFGRLYSVILTLSALWFKIYFIGKRA